MQGLLHGHRLLGMPGLAVVERARDAGRDPEQRVELLDRRVGAVGDERAGVDERAEGVGAVGLPRPEVVGEVAVGGGVAELDGGGDAELREPAHVLRREELRVLDPLAEAARAPFVLRLLERVEGPPVGEVADRVDRDRKAGAGAAADDVDELLVADDLDAGAVEHERRAGAERPVQERLDVPDPQQVVAEARREADLLQALEVVPREGLPDPEAQRALVRRRWKTRSAPSQPSLSWIATTPRESASGIASRQASTISSSVGRT